VAESAGVIYVPWSDSQANNGWDTITQKPVERVVCMYAREGKKSGIKQKERKKQVDTRTRCEVTSGDILVLFLLVHFLQTVLFANRYIHTYGHV
jgi:hypothetical protein